MELEDKVCADWFYPIPNQVALEFKPVQGKEGRELDALLLQYKQAGQARPLTDLVPRLSAKGWFDLMTQRLDNFVVIESLLANHILELGHVSLALPPPSSFGWDHRNAIPPTRRVLKPSRLLLLECTVIVSPHADYWAGLQAT